MKTTKNRLRLVAGETPPRGACEKWTVSDYFPHTAEDIEQLYARLREDVAAIKNPWLNRLVSGVIEDPTVSPRLKTRPRGEK